MVTLQTPTEVESRMLALLLHLYETEETKHLSLKCKEFKFNPIIGTILKKNGFVIKSRGIFSHIKWNPERPRPNLYMVKKLLEEYRAYMNEQTRKSIQKRKEKSRLDKLLEPTPSSIAPVVINAEGIDMGINPTLAETATSPFALQQRVDSVDDKIFALDLKLTDREKALVGKIHNTKSIIEQQLKKLRLRSTGHYHDINALTLKLDSINRWRVQIINLLEAREEEYQLLIAAKSDEQEKVRNLTSIVLILEQENNQLKDYLNKRWYKRLLPFLWKKI